MKEAESSFADEAFRKIQARMKSLKSEDSPPTPHPKPDVYVQEREQHAPIDDALRKIGDALRNMGNAATKAINTFNALNAPLPQSPYEYFPRCERCGDFVTTDRYRNKLCKDCYIIRYGEWRRQ